MPVVYSLDGAILELQFRGEYEPSEIIQGFLAGLADARCPDPVSLLVDVRNSTSLHTRTPSEIRYVAEFLGPYAERIGGRCAIVAEEDIHFGMSRMGSAYSEGVGIEVGVFRDSRAARAWLERRAVGKF